MRLTAVMNLMLKQIQEQAVRPLVLDAAATMNRHEAAEPGVVQASHDGKQAIVHCCLCGL